MPDYIRTATAERITLEQIRAAHPTQSIPAEAAALAPLGYAPLEPTPKPAPADGMIIQAGPPEEYEPGHWRETWLTEPAPPPSVPASVSMRQARLALRAAGLLDQVPATIAAIEDPDIRENVDIEWEYSTSVERNHDWVITLAASFTPPLDDDALDALFIDAATR